jgi:hypothetical protein
MPANCGRKSVRPYFGAYPPAFLRVYPARSEDAQILPPIADRPHEDRSVREESRASGTRLLRDPKLPRLLRAANVLISLTAIVYFLSFLGIVNARVSWFYVAWVFFVQLLIITPQIIPLLVILIIEARTVGTLKRHWIWSVLDYRTNSRNELH